MTIDVSDILRLTLSLDTPDAVVSQLVWHYIVSSGSGADEDDVLTDIKNAWETAFVLIQAHISDVISAESIKMAKWDFGLNQFDTVAEDLSVTMAGAHTTPPVPNATPGVGFVHTQTPRRQARKFFPGWQRGGVTDNDMSAALLTAYANFMGSIADNVVSLPVTLVYCTFNTDPESPLFETESRSNEIGAAVSLLGVLHSRKPGIGI